MKFTPREYQRLIIDHQLALERNQTFAGMGLGKTVSTLTSIDALQLAGEGPALILAPKRVAVSTWPDEAKKWDHLSGMDVVPITGTATERRAALRRDVAVHTMNYDNLQWLVQEIKPNRWPWRVVVPDESTRLKGFRLRNGGRRALYLMHVAWNQHFKRSRTAYGRHVVRRWMNLTGTPAPNGLPDLWGPQYFVDRGAALGATLEAFYSRWFSYNDYSRQHTPLPSAQEQIEARLLATCLTIRSEDWFDLKQPIVNKVHVELPKKARREYEQMEREAFLELEQGEVEAYNPASRINKCSQIANGFVFLNPEAGEAARWEALHDEKLKALESIVSELSGAPLLVAYMYRPDLERILKAFPKARQLDDDPETIRAWNRGEIPMLVAHPKSAGHGLNLQDGGHHLAFYGVDWNLEEHDQIIERIGPVRQLQAGYDRNVFLHYILARDTMDEIKLARLISKRSIQDCLLEALSRRTR